MKKALNQYGKLVDIIESIKEETYICPVCKEELIRNFGISRQYFSHPNGSEDCELKFNLMLKNNEKILSSSDLDILKREYYNKEFNDVHIELSDYMSEEGYYLTQEQKDIIFAEEDRIKIAALAGSAKTSTLYYYAKTRPFKKILYIVYNRSMKDSATTTFGKLRNVTISTIHSLGYQHCGKFYRNKLTTNYGVVDVIKDLNLNWNKHMELAVKINEMMKKYTLSDALDFNDLDLYKDYNGNTTDEREMIINYCRKLWNMQLNYKNNIKITHDTYLKAFHLEKVDLSNKYDIILLDESQDSSLLVLDILKSSNVSGIVLCGDRFQQLYSFRDATDIMPLFDAKEYKLTTSFRISQNTANIANMIIKDICKIDIGMKGFNTKQKIVHEIDKIKPYVCLCRTNAFIFGETVDVITANPNAKLFYESGFSSYAFNNILDGWFFYKGHKVKNQLFNKFKNYSELLDYAKKITDLEILAIDRMIDKYSYRIPEIIESIKKNVTKTKENAHVIFSTIHRSKGSTQNLPVYISDDVFDINAVFKNEYINKEKDKDFHISKFETECFVTYVGITRAYNELCLPEKVKNYLITRNNYFKDK